MRALVIYQLEVAFCIILLYLFYRIMLRKETNFQLKRLFIIFSSLVAFLLPALNIEYGLKTGETSIPLEYLTMIPMQIIAYSPPSAPTNEMNLWLALSVIWGIGFIIMLSRLFFSLYHVNKILKGATNEPDGKIFKITNTNVQSFSFFKTIVLNTRHYHSEAMKYILAHEQAHSNQYHSVDVLLIELLKAIQWFNPFAWLFAMESIQNLEYLADKEVVTSTKNMRDYQLAIVQFAHHSGNKLLKSEFSKSNLKNRIIMMNQPNNQKIHVGKFLLILPLVVALFMSFSIKVENLDLKKEVSELLPILNIPTSSINESWSISSNTQLPVEHQNNDALISIRDTAEISKSEVFSIVDEQPYPSTGDMGLYFEKIHADLNYPAEAKEKDIKGKVFVQFIIQKDGTLREVMAVKGIGYGCDEEAVRVIKNGPLWVAGKQRGHVVAVRMIMPVAFGVDHTYKRSGVSGKIRDNNDNPIIGCNIIIKGTHTGTVTDNQGKFYLEVKPEHKNKKLVFSSLGFISQSRYARNGTTYLIVMNRDEDYQDLPQSENFGISIKASGRELMFEKDQPMFILNGEEIPREDFNLIQPDDIESITVLKDHTAIDKYGEDAKNGVIIINTKNGIKLNSGINLDIDKDNPPLIYKDGVEISLEDIKKINENTIESINVFKGKSAKEKYGEKGKNGVIIIKMKE